MLSQTAMYALRAMAYLGRNGREKPVLSQTIAQEMRVPKNFLSKILNRLVQEGLVDSVRGTGGGFVLSRDPHTIRLLDVVRLFMNLDSYRQCLLGQPDCNGGCRMHKKWAKAQQGLDQLLEKSVIADML